MFVGVDIGLIEIGTVDVRAAIGVIIACVGWQARPPTATANVNKIRQICFNMDFCFRRLRYEMDIEEELS